MACGFDNFEQIRKDKNLAALRKSPKFNVSTCTRIAPCIALAWGLTAGGPAACFLQSKHIASCIDDAKRTQRTHRTLH